MFNFAKPVWAENCEECNTHVTFTASVEGAKKATAKIAAHYFYRLTVNGKFVAFGPARTAYGYARVDEIVLDGLLDKAQNEVRFEVAGYNCRSLSTCKQQSFLCCEIVSGEKALAYTGKDFCCYKNEEHLQKVMRFTGQRHFTEVYDFTKPQAGEKLNVIEVKAPVFLERGVPYPEYDERYASLFGKGKLAYDESILDDLPNFGWRPDFWGGFDDDDVPSKPAYWAFAHHYLDCEPTTLPVSVEVNEYALFDFGKVETGFFTLTLTAKEDSDVVLAFTELGEEKSFAFTGMHVRNVIEYFVSAGKSVTVMTFEPYTTKKIAVAIRTGAVEIESLKLTTYERSTRDIIEHKIEDEKLKEIYDAGVRTFAHNALDLYTDCPSRERAGWLCDSFFTARAEKFLYGKTPIEDAFLENYRLFTNHDGYLPEGVLPMCYPSDVNVYGSKFIPQWAMWYVVEVYEYLTERNTAVDKNLFRDGIYGYLKYLTGFENEFGLLEKLEAWNFVEWSKANSWVQDVNFPTNFLYSRILECTGKLYGDDALLEKAKKVRATALDLSFDGQVFIDNAVRDKNGELKMTRNCSEACQYYALLLCGLDLDDEKYAFLKQQIYEKFANFERGDRDFCEINAFIGLYLRIVFLMDYGDGKLLKDDLIYFFGGMAKETSTLWEHRQRGEGSQDHGFASLACVAAYKAEQLLKNAR